MTGCFDFRLRASPSVDLDRLHDASKFPMSFSKLFRSRSDGSVKTARSQSEGPTALTRSRGQRSPSPVASTSAGIRRRYVRVVRSDDTRDAGNAPENSVHVIVRSRSYGGTDRMRLKKSASADAGVAAGSRGVQLPRAASPYTSSGHTILKKYNHSLDAGIATVDSETTAGVPSEVSPPNSKRTSFREEVEILEYDTQGKYKCVTHMKKLNYEDEDEDDSLNIEDSFDDDLDVADLPLTEIQDEMTSATTTALAPSPASIICKSPMEDDAAAEAAAEAAALDQKNRRHCVDNQASSSTAGHSVLTLDQKGLSPGIPSWAWDPSGSAQLLSEKQTPPSTVVVSDQPSHDGFHSSRRCGDAPNIIEYCVVAHGHQIPVSKYCPGNDHGFSATLSSCPESSPGSPYKPDSCPEYCHNSKLTIESIAGVYQDLNDHYTSQYSPAVNHSLNEHPCPAHMSAHVSNCPSIGVSSGIQSSTRNESASTSHGHSSNVQLAETQQYQAEPVADSLALVTSGAFSNLH